jgi:tetratricopeptide (TPR) repeat protein
MEKRLRARHMTVLWVYSAAGNGKSTVLMRMAYELVKKGTADVWWRPAAVPPETGLDIKLLESLDKPSIVILDDAHMIPNLRNAINACRHRRQGPPILFIIGYQGTHWGRDKPDRGLHNIQNEQYGLNRLSKKEAQGIVEKLKKSGLVEQGESEDHLTDRLILGDKYRADLLTAMLLIVNKTTHFDAIIHKLLDNLHEPTLMEALSMVTAVCRLSEKNFVFNTLLQEVMDMDDADFKIRVLRPLYAELRPFMGDRDYRMLRSRHPLIADEAYRYMVKKNWVFIKEVYTGFIRNAIEYGRFTGDRGAMRLCTNILGQLKCRDLRRLCYREILESDCPDPFFWQSWALMEKDEGRPELARLLYFKATRVDEEDAGSWQAWALMEDRLGDHKKARELFQKGTLADKRHSQSWQAWAMMEDRLGHHEKARELFQKGTQADNKNAPLWQAWAMMEERLEDHEKARELFQKGTLADNKNAPLWQAWALMEDRLGDHEKARELFQKAINVDKSHAQSWQAWALMEDRLGDHEKARELFQKAIHVDKSHVQSWHAWALMEERLGNLTEAHQYMQNSRPYIKGNEKSTGIYQAFMTRHQPGRAGEEPETPAPPSLELEKTSTPSPKKPVIQPPASHDQQRQDSEEPALKSTPQEMIIQPPASHDREAPARSQVTYRDMDNDTLLSEIRRLLDQPRNLDSRASCPPGVLCVSGTCPYAGKRRG